MKFWRLIVFFMFVVLYMPLSGQDKSDSLEIKDLKKEMVVVTLKDGSIIYGYFIERSESHLVMRSVSLDIIKIPIDQIDDIDYLNSIEENEINGFDIDYHNSTKYNLFPSGFGLKKGQSYYENLWVFGNSFAYGVSDRVTLSASTEIASLLFGGDFPLIFVNGKYSIPIQKDKVTFGINASFLTIPSESFTSFSFLTGSLTFGNRNNNFTLGFGAGFKLNTGINDEVVPVTLSYMRRVSKKLSFVTENWFIAENDFDDFYGIVSAGLRIHFKDNGSALNVSLVRPLEGNFDIIAFPFISGTVALK